MPPIDSAAGLKFAVRGRIVTMDDADTVINDGVLYIRDGVIQHVRETSAPTPDGFSDVPVHSLGGTIFPGLIELHNHLPYDVLQLWQVPELFEERSEWRDHADKQKLVTAPMRVLGETQGLIQAVVRYVECKALMGGVTTSQGITLFSAPGSQRFYKGVVRNVENTDDPQLPEAQAKVTDIEPDDVEAFFHKLQGNRSFILHLAEGVNTSVKARAHFLALKRSNGEFAVTPKLAGIHSLGLKPEDLAIYGEKGGAIVWSPLSNMMLYGKTLDLSSVKSAGIRLGIGSDWSPTGSKNLFGELKIARIVSQTQGHVYGDRDLIAMATRNAASILGWTALGSLEPGKYADYMVISGRSGDPYEEFLTASEKRISLVAVHSIPRYGWPSLMHRFGDSTETIRVDSSKRALNLAQATADPLIAGLTLADARIRLTDGLATLDSHGRALAARMTRAAASPRVAFDESPPWMILLDNDQLVEARRLSTPGGPMRSAPMAAAVIRAAAEEAVDQVQLDELTVADDPQYFDRIESQLNLDDAVKTQLEALY